MRHYTDYKKNQFKKFKARIERMEYEVLVLKNQIEEMSRPNGIHTAIIPSEERDKMNQALGFSI